MQDTLNSAVSVADIRKAAAEGWSPSDVLGTIRLVAEREAQKFQGVVDSLESQVYQTFGDKADAMIHAMPYGLDEEDITAEEWQLLGDWYNAVLDRCTVYFSDRQIAEVLHIQVSTALAEVIRQERELFGLDKI